MSGKIYFVWKNIEYTIDSGHNTVGYTQLPSGEYLALGNKFWRIPQDMSNPRLLVPICLILFNQQKTQTIDQSAIYVFESSPYLPNMLEVSHDFSGYKAVANPYLERFICPKCNETSQTLFSCQKCGTEIKHEVILEWPNTPPITTKYGIYVVTSQATCPNCQTQLSLDEQPSKCPNCKMCLQWHITPSTPHMAY